MGRVARPGPYGQGLGLKCTNFNGPGGVLSEMSSDRVGPGLKVTYLLTY